MDVGKAIAAYMERMLKEVQGMKILLLDEHTTPTVSAAYTQSALLEQEVYLTDKLANARRERMPHLTCVVFVRPNAASINALCEELQHPRYRAYWLYFSHSVSKAHIEQLAEADQHQAVQAVQEFFADYVPVTSSHFSLHYAVPPHALWGHTIATWDADALDVHTRALTSVLLSLKKKPVVRYERMSELAKTLAHDVVHQMDTALAPLFDFRRTDVPPLLLILDRRNDPVTPLLTPWTYQAMVHELLGIDNGRTTMHTEQGAQDIVLSVDHDPFFAANLYDNFGDLGASIKEYVVQFQARSASTATIETVQDMKRFVEAYPEFQRLRGNVSKHVALLGELSALVDARRLLTVSELEQSLATRESHASDLKNVQSLLADPQISAEAKLRVAILYALRYQTLGSHQIEAVVRQLIDVGVPESDVAMVYVLLNLAGADQRQGDLFANENLFARGKSALRGLKGVDNVYTQHTPHLVQTLDQLMRGKLRTAQYPFASDANALDAPATVYPGGPPTRPQDVIVFVIGGTTYEEARMIALLNGAAGAAAPAWPGTRFLLGGTTVHRSRSFLDMAQHAAARHPTLARAPPALGSRGPPPLRLGSGPWGESHDLGQVASGARDMAQGLLGRVMRGIDAPL
ncbi:vacuolar protein sorting-associated protein 45 [Malassezia caprae]|uniref:Vacuolar protein sorting-associated protein 45 n=1 Tax=Malassezia caprae TaxID=1381934 RepID=A0AAF0IV54_9BASI|nr:vacuolar protein sorting-associated protein 45 [Malassezia caprae]